jgi:excisionase family DNA binding protein
MRQVTPDDTLVPAATAGEDPRVANLAPVGPQGPAVPPVTPAGGLVDTPQKPGAVPGEVTARGQELHKGKEGKADLCAAPCTVDVAARVLGCSTRTVRRWLQTGRLAGQKRGRDWVVWGLPPAAPVPPEASTPARVRARLRAVGVRLITVGNTMAATAPQPGTVFLAWRAPRSLSVVFAIGRTHPTWGWAPIALGLEYPFWLEGRARWQPVLPLLRRYERLRVWGTAPLLQIPGVQAVLLGELGTLEAALEGLCPRETPPDPTEAPGPETGEATPVGDLPDAR